MLATLVLSFGAAAGLCAGLLFVVAAIAKLRHRAELPAIVANYRLLPRPMVAPVAWTLPSCELVIGLALLVGGRVASLAAGPAILLLALFAVAIGINLRRGRAAIDCGCGIGGLRQSLRIALVYRNLLLALALLPLLLVAGSLAPMERATVDVAGLAAFLLLLLVNALMALPTAKQLAI